MNPSPTPIPKEKEEMKDGPKTFAEFQSRFGLKHTEHQRRDGEITAENVGELRKILYKMIEEITGKALSEKHHKQLRKIIKKYIAFENEESKLQVVKAQQERDIMKTKYEKLERWIMCPECGKRTKRDNQPTT